MDQQQQELRQVAAQAFMESLELLEECLYTAEPSAESIVAESTVAASVDSIAPAQVRPTQLEAKTESRSQSKPAIELNYQINQSVRNRAIEPKIDLQALEEAVADIEQFIHDSKPE